LTEGTVKNHLHIVYGRLGVQSTLEQRQGKPSDQHQSNGSVAPL
jgi:hypothetical protein